VASVTGGNVKARVGTDEVGVNKFFNHFRVSRALVIIINRSVTLTADHRTGNVGVGQDVVLAGGFSVFAARTVTVFATDIHLCVLCFAPRDIDGFNRRLSTSMTISASFRADKSCTPLPFGQKCQEFGGRGRQTFSWRRHLNWSAAASTTVKGNEPRTENSDETGTDEPLHATHPSSPPLLLIMLKVAL
jgi:hypothetical protein